jgi:hypothetical protein
MSFAIIRGKIKEVETFPTREAAARAAGGRDVWIVIRYRDRGGYKQRIVQAVYSELRDWQCAYVFKNADGSEGHIPKYNAHFPTFAAAKASLTKQAAEDVRDAKKALRDAKADQRAARAHRKPRVSK